MQRRTSGLVTVLILAGIGFVGAPAAEPQQQNAASSAPKTPAEFRATLARYCFTCHNEKLKTGGLVLEKMDLANIPAGAETWEKVIVKLRANAMPPARLPHP